MITIDYAGYQDVKEKHHPDNYTITNEMDSYLFVNTIQNYLLDLEDRHLIFASMKTHSTEAGFSVRRYEDFLYVTDVRDEIAVQLGDKIILIDGLTIPQLEETNRKLLMDSVPERQLWNNVIKRSHVCVIERNNNIVEVFIQQYFNKSYLPEHSFQTLQDNVNYIKLNDFVAEKSIQQLIDEHHNEIINSEYLIIDVRVNYGGSDVSYFPLLPYIFADKRTFSSLFTEDEVMFVNYTERNCRLRIDEFNQYLQQGLDDYTTEVLRDEIKLLEKNNGKGLLQVDSSEDFFVIEGLPTPKQVFILSDCYCGSSGDTFVWNAKKSSKVKVIGRNTMGITDYSNLATIDYGDYQLMYATSKMNEKNYINGKGIEPDIYIPWTPEHIYTDKDLETVLSIIKQNSLLL